MNSFVSAALALPDRGERLSARTRVQTIDVLRGLVIVIMALDHVRDYFHESLYAYDPLDPNATTALLYVTRWVTHFCAPTFVLLAGVSAWLQAAKGKSPADLARFLLTRGLWLIVLEVTVIAFGWSFSIPLLPHLQVIWAIGVSMCALAALIWLPSSVVLAVGVMIVAGHNLLDPIAPEQLGRFADVWRILHDGGMIARNGAPLVVAFYPVLPWIGVMALGYGLGPVFLSSSRDRILVAIATVLLAVFVILRGINGYGNPQRWTVQADVGKTVMAFLAVQKYPPSLLYVCVTLGPMLLLIPLFERIRGRVTEWFRVFGAVPLFAYVLHLYVLHALAVVAHAAAGQNTDGMFNTVHDLFLTPQVFAGTGFSIVTAYLAWVGVVALIYVPCRWWGEVKSRRRDWWLSYL
jgi:uncharacterized membrane protein